MWMKVLHWKDKWPELTSDNLKRQFKFLSVLGESALSQEDLAKVSMNRFLKFCIFR